MRFGVAPRRPTLPQAPPWWELPRDQVPRGGRPKRNFLIKTCLSKKGNYAVKIVRELAKGCKMKVSNPTKGRILKQLLNGRLPAGMIWPNPGVATPEYIRPYLA